MNTFLSGGISLLVLSPALAAPPTRTDYPLPGQGTVSVIPVGGLGSDPSSRMPLREVLRQPLDGLVDPGKLYRLSVEERQRLREQLRNQLQHTENK